MIKFKKSKNKKQKKRKNKEKEEIINKSDTFQSNTNNNNNNDNNILNIGLFGNEKSGKKEISLKYLLEDCFTSLETIKNNEDLFKIIEVNNLIRKTNFKIDFPYDFSEINPFK